VTSEILQDAFTTQSSTRIGKGEVSDWRTIILFSMYDDTCRFLAEHFSADFASWLLGSISMTEIQPSELSLDPIRADALILLESDKSILHIEFQTLPKNAIPFRVLDYRVRMYRKDPTKLMRQNLMAASGILAGLKLEQEVIYRLLRRDIMQESTVYRSILAEGKAETQREIAMNLLQAGISVNIIASTTGLLIEEVQQLQQQLSNSVQS